METYTVEKIRQMKSQELNREINRRTVHNAINRLEKKGALYIERIGQGGQYHFPPHEAFLILTEIKDSPGRPRQK